MLMTTEPRTVGSLQIITSLMLQVATETELISRSETFEQAMKENALAQFCDYKVSATEGDDQETWLYLRILFEADPKRYVVTVMLILP